MTGHGEAHYRQVAEIYMEAIADGSWKPTSAVERTYGLKTPTARAWVRRARQLGYIEESWSALTRKAAATRGARCRGCSVHCPPAGGDGVG